MLSDALVEVLGKIQNNEEITRTPQDKANCFIEAPRVDGCFRIRWNSKNIYEIERLIRATNPFYSAFTFFRGVNLKVIKASVIAQKHNFKFGQIVECDDKTLLVAAIGGFVSLEVFQLNSWGVFNSKDFYYTFSPKTDEILL